mmetsp:Transcript_84678/g.137293  ORF Transcript_84678/g.137293 Transcript_84678/m.137293 type:complete len:389 (-) Transcript_84678:28-1194(-)|eukprot:CAMPEP_0179445646 /NCGR_PEP_ID=MMETSP0799-20121207/29063_1 /TAXON_ID=46947 /ORGANISM="Geminigera cryophila, Strain CCMP2564" /LENGTH=388 /DNA_ID=CAMNT_0021233839 /DNA_START=74 /DNA_END=1240 /DNA_ORIENTATION=-
MALHRDQLIAPLRTVLVVVLLLPASGRANEICSSKRQWTPKGVLYWECLDTSRSKRDQVVGNSLGCNGKCLLVEDEVKCRSVVGRMADIRFSKWVKYECKDLADKCDDEEELTWELSCGLQSKNYLSEKCCSGNSVGQLECGTFKLVDACQRAQPPSQSSTPMPVGAKEDAIPANTKSESNSDANVGIIIGVAVGVVSALVVGCFAAYSCRPKRAETQALPMSVPVPMAERVPMQHTATLPPSSHAAGLGQQYGRVLGWQAPRQSYAPHPTAAPVAGYRHSAPLPPPPSYSHASHSPHSLALPPPPYSGIAHGVAQGSGQARRQGAVQHEPSVNSSIADDACVVCLDNKAVFAIVPCGHRCVCEGCSAALSLCPMCRGPKEGLLRIFG